jgi:hypothetical protein
VLAAACSASPGAVTTSKPEKPDGVASFHVLASGLSLGPGVNEILATPSSGSTRARTFSLTKS